MTVYRNKHVIKVVLDTYEIIKYNEGMELKMRLAEITKRVAKEQNLSMRDFGIAIGVSRQTIHNWQTGVVLPSANRLLELRAHDDWRGDMADKMLTVIAAELLA